jgi:Protein of unknown function (DUF1553)
MLFPEIGQVDAAAPREQRLKQLADLMTSNQNGRFARTIVNRLWHRLMGRGIVHPLDAMQTEPWNPDLLDYLAAYLVEQKHDVKKVLALIASSEAYRSQSEVVSEARETAYHYAGQRARRLTAEQFMDSVWQLTGTAPNKFDAPIVHAILDEKDNDHLLPKANWIWGASPDGPPNAGEKRVFHKVIELPKSPTIAGAVVTCDNEFRLFINGREVDRSEDFAQLHLVSLEDQLREGSNDIVLVCRNAGKTPNAAGLFFAGYVVCEGSRSQTIVSDSSWSWSASIPTIKDSSLGELPDDFQPAVLVETVKAWSDNIDPQFRSLYMQLASNKKLMIRASLLKNTALMRSLGRPTRDQIVSMRPSELTTLEAIDLANEGELAAAFRKGAEKLVKQFPDDSKSLVQYVLWAVCMLPEFWLVR